MTRIEIDNTLVYRQNIPSDIAQLYATATASELKHIEGIKSQRRQAEILLTHFMLRMIFGEDIRYSHDDNGAPQVNRDCYISISHCADEVVIAVDETCRIGVDVELWREQLPRVMPRVMSEPERAFYHSARHMLQAWTAKEAIYKAAGVAGLEFASEISLPLSPDVSTAIVASGDDRRYFALTYIEVSSHKCVTLARFMTAEDVKK